MLRQWWTQSNRASLIQAQENLLRRFVVANHHKNNDHIHIVANPIVAGLNSVTFTAAPSNDHHKDRTPPKQIIVLAHGFGSGLGFFYPVVGVNNTKVVAVDWLGMGGSDRPVCLSAPIRRGHWTSFSFCDSGLTVAEAVDFFVDPFHAWMQELVGPHDDVSVTLVGHSLGGYLAARYALKYHCHNTNNKNNDNNRATAATATAFLNKLILASPVGLAAPPANPYEVDQLPTFSLRLLDALWSRNVTPQQLVRWMGATRGRRNVQRILRGRLSTLPDDDIHILADYLYHVTVAAPSGEYAMNSLLEPIVSPENMGVYAREPLDGPLFQTLVQHGPSTMRVLYGDHDWMRPGNETSARRALAAKDTANRSSNNNEQKNDRSVEIIANAGHHLYLENPKEFAHHILR
jgi:cardiolipin-specific phospholipase